MLKVPTSFIEYRKKCVSTSLQYQCIFSNEAYKHILDHYYLLCGIGRYIFQNIHSMTFLRGPHELDYLKHVDVISANDCICFETA